MTKKEIVRVISEELGLTQQDTKEVVQRTFDSIIETLVREGRIELRNFGVFEVKPRAARKARNPKTGQSVMVPAKMVVTFKPGKVMEKRVAEVDPEDLPETWYTIANEATANDAGVSSHDDSFHGAADTTDPNARPGDSSLNSDGLADSLRPSGRWDVD
ncbi:MAG: HU family DNA-binding protein [Planctomycetota bacterium]